VSQAKRDIVMHLEETSACDSKNICVAARMHIDVGQKGFKASGSTKEHCKKKLTTSFDTIIRGNSGGRRFLFDRCFSTVPACVAVYSTPCLRKAL